MVGKPGSLSQVPNLTLVLDLLNILFFLNQFTKSLTYLRNQNFTRKMLRKIVQLHFVEQLPEHFTGAGSRVSCTKAYMQLILLWLYYYESCLILSFIYVHLFTPPKWKWKSLELLFRKYIFWESFSTLYFCFIFLCLSVG